MQNSPRSDSDRITIHFARVIEVGNDATARVSLKELDGIQSYWLPVGQYRAGSQNTAYWMPDIGEQVLVVLDESGSQGCIICGIYSTSDPSPSTDTDLFAIAVPLTTLDGNLVITGNVTITGDVTITGPVDMTGDVTVDGSHTINNKETLVIGAVDSQGHVNVSSGQ